MLICTRGLPGSGKTTLARALGLPIASSDETRHLLTRLGMLPPLPPLIFEESQKEHLAYWRLVHSLTLQRAAAFLDAGETVILDATHLTRVAQQRSIELAQRFGHPILFLDVHASWEELLRRLGARPEGLDYWLPVVMRMLRSTEPLPEDVARIRIDSTSPASLVLSWTLLSSVINRPIPSPLSFLLSASPLPPSQEERWLSSAPPAGQGLNSLETGTPLPAQSG